LVDVDAESKDPGLRWHGFCERPEFRDGYASVRDHYLFATLRSAHQLGEEIPRVVSVVERKGWLG
jgi:hypothetical protein